MTELEKTTAFGGAAILAAALAFGTAPSRSAPDAFFDVGETFFPEFTDPEAATSLEVVEFDEDTAAAAVFRVIQPGRVVDHPVASRLSRRRGGTAREHRGRHDRHHQG